MTWSEWQKLATDLFARLSLETCLIERLCSGRTGDMSNQDIRNFLEHLRERLMIKSTSSLIYAREKSFTSRLEALGALAAMVKELNETL